MKERIRRICFLLLHATFCSLLLLLVARVEAWSAPSPKTTGIRQAQRSAKTNTPNLPTTHTSTSTSSIQSTFTRKKKKKKINHSNNNKKPSQQQQSLAFLLQKSTTPVQVLQHVGAQLSPLVDPHGSIASLTLVRLSKQLMTLQNEYLHHGVAVDDDGVDGDVDNKDRHKKVNAEEEANDEYSCWNSKVRQVWASLETPTATTAATLDQVIQTLASTTHGKTRTTTTELEPIVEGTKAVAILARLMPDLVTLESCRPLLEYWRNTTAVDATRTSNISSQQQQQQQQSFQAHQLSGLHWAYGCLRYVYGDSSGVDSGVDNINNDDRLLQLPTDLQQAYQECQLPFYVIPGFLGHWKDVTVENLVSQVNFQVDAIRTTSTNRKVQERRATAWEGDESGVAPFAYSGKSMTRHSWSPLVKRIRDELALTQKGDDGVGGSGGGGIYYDGCLLNHYPDGGSAMRYHSDPDQGQIWDFETAVVSVGASRRVAFRQTTIAELQTKSNEKTQKQQQQPHTFAVMHGDAMIMVDDCQQRFQHAVKPADEKGEQAARASLVFKRTLSRDKGGTAI